MTTLDINSSTQENTPLMNDETRRIVAVRATHEIDVLSSLLEKEIKSFKDVELTALRCITKRIQYLNCIVMSAIDDDLECTESIQQRFN